MAHCNLNAEAPHQPSPPRTGPAVPTEENSSWPERTQAGAAGLAPSTPSPVKAVAGGRRRRRVPEEVVDILLPPTVAGEVHRASDLPGLEDASRVGLL